MKGILVGWQDHFKQPSNIPPIAGQRRSTSPQSFHRYHREAAETEASHFTCPPQARRSAEFLGDVATREVLCLRVTRSPLIAANESSPEIGKSIRINRYRGLAPTASRGCHLAVNEVQVTGGVRRPLTKWIINSTIAMTNRIQEICVATPATPDKPRAAAIRPTTRNTNA